MSNNLQTDLLNDAKIYGESLLKLPHDLYIPPDALEVYLDSFQGPLDLLLYLIRKNNIDILDIPMATLTTQYIEYVEKMKQMEKQKEKVQRKAFDVNKKLMIAQAIASTAAGIAATIPLTASISLLLIDGA